MVAQYAKNKAYRLPDTPLPNKLGPEAREKRDRLLARLRIQHMTAQSVYYFLGSWPQTQALLDRLVAKGKIELHDGKYRPVGWVDPRPSGRQAQFRESAKWGVI